MRKDTYISIALVIVAICLLFIAAWVRRNKAAPSRVDHGALTATIAGLQEQMRNLYAQKKAADLKVEELKGEIAQLIQTKEEDRQVIKDLWDLLVASRRNNKSQSPPGGSTTAPTGNAVGTTTPQAQPDSPKYTADSVRKMLTSSGGNLEAVVQEITTEEGIDAVLQEHRNEPAYWTAAASLTQDPQKKMQYIEEAAALHPDSPEVLKALVQEKIRAGQIDESTRAWIQQLERLDPTNALGDCYDTHANFESGNVPAALESLARAAAKGRFADDRMEMLMARYDYMLNEGCDENVAIGVSAFTLPLEHLGMIRQIEQNAIAQAQALTAAGQYDASVKITQDVAALGRSVASSGRFLVHDRVGVALQQAALSEQMQIYEATQNLPQIQQVDSKLQAIQDLTETIDIMVKGFGPVMASMTDDEIASYIDQTILNGEFTTLQNMPEIAEALKQAPPQAAMQDNQAQTTTP